MLILSGMMVGFCFDFYRILRWRLKLKKVFTLIGDLTFSLVALAVIFFIAQKANYLEFRFYLFGASLLGLLLYLRFISPLCKKIFNFIFSLIAGIKNIITHTISAFFKLCARVLTLVMSIPYGILRWLALLLFRIGQAFGVESKNRIKRKIDKIPKE